MDHRLTIHYPGHTIQSVFINARDGKSGLVICNYDEHTPVTVNANLDSGEVLSHYRLVDDSNWLPVESGIIIPVQSAVVVI